MYRENASSVVRVCVNRTRSGGPPASSAEQRFAFMATGSSFAGSARDLGCAFTTITNTPVSMWGHRRRKICIHKQVKMNCKECGVGHCIHKIKRYNCKICSGRFCRHGLVKKYCAECDGSGLCPHGRHRTCQICRIGYCQHATRREICDKCRHKPLAAPVPPVAPSPWGARPHGSTSGAV